LDTNSPFRIIVPDLGPAKLPIKTPYDELINERKAYIDGFKIGWEIMQCAGKPSLVAAPEEYCEPVDIHNAWYDGVSDGKKAATIKWKELDKKNIGKNGGTSEQITNKW
jgi:hypothetical protein